MIPKEDRVYVATLRKLAKEQQEVFAGMVEGAGWKHWLQLTISEIFKNGKWHYLYTVETIDEGKVTRMRQYTTEPGTKKETYRQMQLTFTIVFYEARKYIYEEERNTCT